MTGKPGGVQEKEGTGARAPSPPLTHTHTCMVNQREKETLLMACAGPRCRRAEMEEMIAEMLFYRGDAGISLVGMEGW